MSTTAWMNEIALVPISQDLYREVLRRFPKGVHSVVEDVVRDFLERTADEVKSGHTTKDGLWFGAVFLPDGTRLRTKYQRAYRYMEITGDSIIHDGQRYPSVSQVVNFVRGQTSNNAWKVLEIQRPTDPAWVPAESLRRRAPGT